MEPHCRSSDRARANFQQQNPPPRSISTPMNQQPTRSLAARIWSAKPTYTPPAPRTQIEAMPPTPLPVSSTQERQAMLDASKRHPVFFTDRLKKAPVGVDAGNGAWTSPVAMGYVFNDGVKSVEGGVKL